MSDTASWFRRYGLEIAWGIFALINLLLMWVFPYYPTIPFHFIWISLTVLYGVRTWRRAPMLVVLAAICVATGTAMWTLTSRGFVDLEEVAEVPLMAAVFLAMVWHANRRQAALEEADRLAASERALRERERTFARQASHQLRGPIAVARGHAQLILQQTVAQQVVEDVNVIIDELDKLSGTARRLLQLGAIELKETLDLAACDVDDFVSTAAGRWATAFDRSWVVSARTGAVVLLDRERVEAALYELIDNAVKHTTVDGRIAVAVAVRNPHLVLSVADDGVGIAAQDIASVFDQFWRGSSRPYQGAGLGLAIVKAVATVHGGEATVRANPEGGTTFELGLPMRSVGRTNRPVPTQNMTIPLQTPDPA